jgi:hypothetical protein
MIQCTREDGSCDAMAREIDFMPHVHKEVSTKYKYVVDVDGYVEMMYTRYVVLIK